MTKAVSNLEASVSTVNLTPEKPALMVGYQSRIAFCEIADNAAIEANITALRAPADPKNIVIIIALDSLFIDDEFIENLQRKIKLPILDGKIMAVASHTHGAPNLQSRTFIGCPQNEDYISAVLVKLSEAIKVLFVDDGLWEPISEMSFRKVKFDELICRRRIGYYFDLRNKRFRYGCHYGQNPKGLTDPYVRSLEIRTKAGVKAVFWSYPAHPAFFPNNHQLNADFPGVVRDRLKQRYENAAILFFPGLSGSVIPKVNPVVSSGNLFKNIIYKLPFIPKLGQFSEEEFYQWTDKISATFEVPAQKSLYTEQSLSFLSHRIDTITGPTDAAFPVNIGILEIADFKIIAMSAEPVADWQLLLTPYVNDEFILTGYLAGPAGYIATSELLEQGGYEVDGFKISFGFEGVISKNVNDIITKAVKRSLSR